jgi:3-methyladenine DNA glycosylase AlkD
MDAQAEKQHLLDRIKEYADPEYAQVISRTIPSKLDIYGLRVFELRQIVGAWRRGHKEATREHLLVLVEALWEGASREERMLALELLQHYPHHIPQLTWSRFERWRHDLDNWELTDVLGVGVLGLWVLGDADARAQHLRDLIAGEGVWSRRLGLVGAIGLNRARKDGSFPQLTFALMDQVKEERHPMITKAVSWMLRDLSKKHPDLVAAYLEDNRDLLADHVVREVTNKLKTGRKSGK